HLLLEVAADRGEFAEFGHGLAVDFLHAFAGGVVLGQEGVGDDPVEVVALAGAGGPLFDAPGAGDARGGVRLFLAQGGPTLIGADWEFAAFEVDDAGGGAAEADGGGGE